MEPEIPKLGSSLLVPCVQELAKESLITVPPRYLRPHQESPIIFNTTSSLPQVPVIDMQSLCSESEELLNFELDKLHHACKEWGFFQIVSELLRLGSNPYRKSVFSLSFMNNMSMLQLINHGVSTSLVEKVKVEIQEFFNLSMEEKKKYWQKPGEMEGFGQAFVVSEEQKLDWGDIFYMMTLPLHLRKPYLFPKLPLPFRDTLESYSGEMKGLALKILSFMEKALAMEAEEMREIFEEGCQKIRMNYYPPCPQPELVMGLNNHTDAIGLTILLQVNDVEGLQIKKDGKWLTIKPLPNAFVINIGDILELVMGLNNHTDAIGLTILLQVNDVEGLQINKDGKWLTIKPLPNAFVINIGDILEILTNGIYKSTEHRATVNSVKERISIATFYSPGLDGEIGPARSLISPERPALFKRIGVADFFRGYFSRELVGKSYLDVVRIQNSELKNN